MPRCQRGHARGRVASLQEVYFLFRIELPGAQNHARHDVGRRSEPADGHPLAFEVFEVDDVLSDDKNMFETVDGHRHEFEIGHA